ncbi:IclR family transcriptional regulator C-terminal domain-containing protein [Rhodococcus sp. C26F]
MSNSRTIKQDAQESVKSSSRAPEGMAGLAKGLAVIEAFDIRHPQLTVTDAAQRTNTSRAAARRCLLTLVELGYLTHDNGNFRPTPRMLRLSGAYLDTAPLPQLAQPQLTEARDALDESVSLAVLEDGWALFVARAEATRIVSTGVRVGAKLPAHNSATGRVLLAGLTDTQLDDYLRQCNLQTRTPQTLTDIDAVRERILAARESGMAYTDEEIELGMLSIAVPVRNARGETVAAMSVSASTARTTLHDLQEAAVPVLNEYAERLGRLL